MPSTGPTPVAWASKLRRVGVLDGRFGLSLVHSSRRLVDGRVRAFLDFMIERGGARA